MEFNSTSLETALNTLGQFLLDKGLFYEVVAIGGGGLLLLGLIPRTTKDLDLVALIQEGKMISASPLPNPLLQAIRDVGIALDLNKDWVNAGPAILLNMGLPEGFKNRMLTFHYGGLTVHLADRFDQICFKLYASVDQGPSSKHYADLKLLMPTQAELEKAQIWCRTQDVSEEFSKDLKAALSGLGG